MLEVYDKMNNRLQGLSNYSIYTIWSGTYGACSNQIRDKV